MTPLARDTMMRRLRALLEDRTPKYQRICKVCGHLFASPNKMRTICSPDCRRSRAPAVYRFVCPDGRSYVGAVSDISERTKYGVDRSNARLRAAFERYPSGRWTFEVLEQLRPGCSKQELHTAEQHHIERLRSWLPDNGFNIRRYAR